MKLNPLMSLKKLLVVWTVELLLLDRALLLFVLLNRSDR